MQLESECEQCGFRVTMKKKGKTHAWCRYADKRAKIQDLGSCRSGQNTRVGFKAPQGSVFPGVLGSNRGVSPEFLH